MNMSSSILSNSSKDTSLSLNEYTTKKITYNDLLQELNDEIHEASVLFNIDYYRTLTECSLNNISDEILNENVIESIKSTVRKIITAIKNFCAKVYTYYIIHINDTEKMYSRIKELFEKENNKIIFSSTKLVVNNISLCPIIVSKSTDIDERLKHLYNILNTYKEAIEKYNNPENMERLEYVFKEDLKHIPAIVNDIVPVSVDINNINIENTDQYLEFARAFLMTPKNINFNHDLIERYINEASIDSKEESKKTINAINNISKRMEDFANSIDEDKVESAKKVIQAFYDICRISTTIISYRLQNQAYNAKSILEAMMKELKAYKRSAVYEAYTPDNSLDLELTTESYEMSYDYMEFYKNLALNEALILTDDKPKKISRLISMREAEVSKAEENVGKSIENIKGMVDKFYTKLSTRMKANADYIKRNQDLINKPISLQSASSNGDILAGMYRVQNPIKIVSFNDKDNLDSKEEFFKKYLLDSFNQKSQFSKRQVDFSNDTSIVDFCKAYYGASMPEVNYKKCEFSKAELEANKPNMIKFLQSTDAFLRSIKNDLTKLDNESKRYLNDNKSGRENIKPTNNNENNNENNKTTGKNESYYSILFGKYITEADIVKGDVANNDGNHNNNVAVNDIASFRNYMNCYKDIFASKLTAAEFITSEVGQIIRAHASTYMNSKQLNAEKDIANKEKK